METNKLLENFKLLVNHRLEELLNVSLIPQARLIEAAKYAVLHDGKRLRPLLILSVLQDYHIPIEKGLDPACSIELLHNYSLIHDDLPCMDNDDFRRGRPTLHKVFPESLAVLTGDFLLTYAFEVLTNTSLLLDQQKLQLVKILSKRAGLHGMIGGQVVDIESEGQMISWETLHFMHLHKTAALFMACLEIGGIIASVPQNDFKVLQMAGKALGVSFQIINDLFDEKTPEKSPTSDITNNKATALTMLGKGQAQEKAASLLEQALKELNELSVPANTIKTLIQQLLDKISITTLN